MSPEHRATAFTRTLLSIAGSDSTTLYRRAAIVLTACVLILGAVVLAAGAPPVTGAWNTMVLLDAGWRIVSGQVPHTDFHTPVGPLTYLLVAAGMKLDGASTFSVTAGLVLFMALAAPLAWAVVSPRLPWPLAFLFVLFICIFILSPRPLGADVHEMTYGMVYNREGYLLLCTALIGAWLHPRVGTPRATLVGGLCTGLLLALMLYCKITYFLVAAVLIAVTLVLERHPRRWYAASAAAFAAVCAAMFAFFHIGLRSYLSDVAQAGHSQSLAMRMGLLATAVANNGLWIYLLAFCVAVCLWLEARAGASPTGVLRACVLPTTTIAGALLLNVGNSSQKGAGDDPLYFVTTLIFFELYRRRTAGHGVRSSDAPAARDDRAFVRVASLLLLVPIFCGPILCKDLESHAYALAWNILKRPSFDPSLRLDSPRLKDFYVPQSTTHVTAYWLAREHPTMINDGLELLKRNLRDGDRVTTIAITNPFSFALSLPPARDGLLWWDLEMSFDPSHRPSAHDFLGDASVVMVPRLLGRQIGCCFDTVDTLMALYGPYLHEHFREIASTNVWALYRRF